MIVCILDSLPTKEDTALRLWLGKGECQTFIRVLQSKVKALECEYLASALEASAQNDKQLAADASLLQAKRYAAALDVLRELSEQQTPFQIAKLS